MGPAQLPDRIEVDPGVTRRIGLKIREREGEKARRRTKPLLLQMDEAARHLNKALVKFGLRPSPKRQPDFLQHIVRFVVKLRVEAAEKADIMAVESRQFRKTRQQSVDLR